MKNTIKIVWATTLVVLATPLVAGIITTPIQFYLLILGVNALIFYMAYQVLTDKYSTSKKFNDWYEDVPKQQ